MKLLLQIFFAVFFANIASGLVLDTWRSYQTNLAKQVEEQALVEAEQARLQRNDQIRTMFIQHQEKLKSGQVDKTPLPNFVPDDVSSQSQNPASEP